MRPLPLLALLLVSARAPADTDAVALDRAQPMVEATIGGVPARLAVTLDEGVYLSGPFAARVPLPWVTGGYEEVGRVRVRLRRASGPVVIRGVSRSMRMQAEDGPCCAGRDGTIGAADLPWSVVRIGEGGQAPEQRFPASVDVQSGLSIPWKVGGTVIHVVLAPDTPETVATASAASALAKAYGGQFTGQGRDVVLAFGVTRKVRDMALAKPATLLGRPLDRIAVRLADFGGGAKLPEEPGGEGITVRRKVAAQRRWPAITVGQDRLGHCPAITLYRDAGAIGLVCD
jgi:hypothetical protein